MKRKARIAFLEEWPSLRANRVLPYLTKEFEITYITCEMGNFPKGDFKEVIKFPAPKFMLQRAWNFARAKDKLYEQRRIDFAYVYSSIGFLIRKTPYIHLLGGSALEDFKIKWARSGLYKKILLLKGLIHYSLPELVACKRAKKIITNSRALKEEISNSYNLRNKDISVIYNGVDIDFYNIQGSKLEEPGKNILFTGRLHFRKGILELVKEFSKRGDIRSNFYIAGFGPDYEAMRNLALKDSRIKVMGEVEKGRLKEIMRITSIFLFPSFHEGCPNSLLEAMASGHACIAYDIPAVREVLQDSGILVEVGKPQRICDELEKLLSDESKVKNFSKIAYERAKSFSWDSCAEKLADVFRCMHEELRGN